MLQVSPGSEFTRFGLVDLERGNDAGAAPLAGCRRLRSCSLFVPEGSGRIDLNFSRPRSRSFYMCEPDDSSESRSEGTSTGRSFSLQTDLEKKDDSHTKLAPKRSKACTHKHLKKDHTGSKGSPNVPMLTISEPDSWEINSSSGMKYGQYVDWEKIDPESAVRYKKILSTDHSGLKEMARSGFWTMPHTLRAKAYHHIIQRIECLPNVVDTDTYKDLSERLFEEHNTSTHPFPKFMADGEIPRYCLNKAGLNSVRKILLCLSHHFPEMTFCPILPALVSLLLHYSEDEPQCFHSICSLVSYTDPEKRYIDQTFLTTHASCMTFGDLANKYCRGIRKLIASSHQSLFEFYSDWIMWIFADLPFSYAIWVLDVYLIEGYKVLYRVALALLSLYKVSVSSRVAHVDDFKQDMKRFVENVSRHSSIDALLERAFSIQLPTRRELNFLYNANKQALIQRGIQNQSSYQSVELGGFCSSVVSMTEMRVVWAWIPERFALFSPVRLFSTNDHGRSLTSLYSHVEGCEPTVLLLKTVDEEICGAFLSSDWALRNHDGNSLYFFGTEECFVFTLRPGMERYQRPVLHISGMSGTSESPRESFSFFNSSSSTCRFTHSARTNQDPNYLSVPYSSPQPHPPTARFMAGNNEMLMIGGEGGHALSLFADLFEGHSEQCDTFESPVLCRGRFRIHSLEVWGIQHTMTLPPHTHTVPNTLRHPQSQA
ncbi:TBC1 domain family member 24 isoform X2 [Astyanax mexicanus]|uniref:TBC1 domain family member 24 isoform X2 n=1 Tax=Astyanax mexicanus TaxID=7994 RepID=UPI0020CAF1AE|nr:TBC1 domain family member 24 isoform X2 [Astyanax mexicanus]